MILDIDAGNTRLKWRLARESGGEVCAWGATPAGDPDFSVLRGQSITDVRMSSVLDAARETALLERLSGLLGLRPRMAQTTRTAGGVTNSYADVSRMGVDRWLAMVAAYGAVHGPVCVVDVGTTLTVDCVLGDGRHLGGFIVPGLRMLEDTVYGGTGRVSRLQENDAPAILPGRSTESAVCNGALAMLTGLVHHGCACLEREGGGLPEILATGGGVGEILEWLPGRTLVRRDLVLDGLAIVSP